MPIAARRCAFCTSGFAEPVRADEYEPHCELDQISHVNRLGDPPVGLLGNGNRAAEEPGVAEPLCYPLYTTISKITILDWGSKSGDGSGNFFTNSSCLSAPPTLLRNGSALLYGSFSKYICVTILSWRPLTWKWMCAGLILLGQDEAGVGRGDDAPDL